MLLETLSSKMNRNWYGGVIQPETAFISFFTTSEHDPFVTQNTKSFIINVLFIAFMVFTIKFTFAEKLPTVLQVIGITAGCVMSTIFLLKFIIRFNQKIVKQKFSGFFQSICTLIAIITIMGVFV